MPTARNTTAAAEADGLRIDESERKSWTSIAFIRAGGMFSAPTLMVGAALGLGLALSGAALATLVGFGFIVAYMCFVSMQASDLGLPTASLAAPALGRTGARYLVSLIVGVVTIGWFGVQTAVCGASLALMLAGAALAIVTGQGDIARIMNSIGLPAVGLIALVLSAWTVNASNVYSAGLGFAVMLGKGEGGSKLTTAVSGVAGIVLAVGGILGQFEAFLTVLSACGPALAGVMVADYWLVRKGRPANVRVPDGVSAAGVAGLACGIAVALVTGGTFALVPGLEALDLPFFVGPVNGIVVAMAAYALSYRLTGGERFAGPVAFKRPAESAIMNQVTLDASERAQEGQA